jgi:hypothetical protein
MIKICYSLITEDPPAAGKNINLSLGNVNQVFCHYNLSELMPRSVWGSAYTVIPKYLNFAT